MALKRWFRGTEIMSMQRRDSGATLTELLAVMVLFGILCGIAALGLSPVLQGLAVRGTQREVVGQLHQVQTRAISEDSTYCVDFGGATSTTFTIYRIGGTGSGVLPAGYACTSGTSAGSYSVQSKAKFGSAAFTQRNNANTSYIVTVQVPQVMDSRRLLGSRVDR